MGIARKIGRNQARKSVAGLGDALKALSNLDQVKDLNALLGLVREVMPRLIEVQGACAALIQERKDLERSIHRDRAVLLGMISHFTRIQPDAVLEHYEEMVRQWDAENPLPPVGAEDTEAVPRVIAPPELTA